MIPNTYTILRTRYEDGTTRYFLRSHHAENGRQWSADWPDCATLRGLRFCIKVLRSCGFRRRELGWPRHRCPVWDHKPGLRVRINRSGDLKD